MNDTPDLAKIASSLVKRDMILNIIYPAFVAIMLLVQGALIGVSINNSNHIYRNTEQINSNTVIIMENQKLLTQLLDNEKEEIKYLRMLGRDGYTFESPGK
jgi:hypothetical protein